MDSAKNTQLPHDIGHYIEELSHKPQYIEKFGVYAYATRSVVQNLVDNVEPCIVIEKYVQTLVENAIASVRRNGHSPKWIGAAFCVEGVSEFHLNWKPTETNYTDRLHEELKKYHKSVQCLNLTKIPINIRITIVADPRTVL